MRKRRWLYFSVAFLVALMLLACSPARYVLLGFLRAEPFFECMPAAYWGDLLDQHHTELENPCFQEPCLIIRLLERLRPSLRRHDMPETPHILQGHPAAGPVLLALLKDKRNEVRYLASYALMEIRPVDVEAEARLLQVLREESDQSVAYHICLNLKSINPVSEMKAFQALLENPEPNVRTLVTLFPNLLFYGVHCTWP
jgi:hypothetical protein